jgi:hypothetical protein
VDILVQTRVASKVSSSATGREILDWGTKSLMSQDLRLGLGEAILGELRPIID